MCARVTLVFTGLNGWRIARRMRRLSLLRMGTMTMNPTRLAHAMLFAAALFASSAFAQTFKMPCEVEATIPAMEDVKIKPQKVVIEIQSMGKNIFLKMSQRSASSKPLSS
jgi:hypothetical protein